MSKFIMVALLIASLIAGATPVMAQGVTQGGIGDPLTLAASGVVIPFLTALAGQPVVSTLQVASPVSDNPNAHLFFFNADCARIPISVGIPLTTNDIAFQQIAAAQGGPIAAGVNGLVTIAQSDPTGFTLIPLDNGHPIHVRLYLFSTADGRSRVIEPIILNTAEFPSIAHWWSPLRTGADFFAPLQTAAVQTDLFLICPKDTIEGGAGAAFGVDPGGTGNVDFTSTGFPQINPRFPTGAGALSNVIRVRVYDTFEVFKRDFTIDCNCVIIYTGIATSINPFYADPVEAAFGTYTEITSVPGSPRRVTFTGYTSTYTVGSAINAFFARFHNGSQPSIDGALTSTR